MTLRFKKKRDSSDIITPAANATTQPGNTNPPRVAAAIGNYATAVRTKPGHRLTHVAPAFVDNIPDILFTSLEEDELCK